MKYFFLAILLTSFYLNLYCQNDLSSISFELEEEKLLLQNYSNETAFKLLFLIDNKDFNESKLNKYINDYYVFLDKIKKRIKKKRRKKAASYIYKEIHDQYFSKYVNNPRFSEIFSKKEYNCVTASAFFAIGLNYLNIPFEIRETPIHVYLILYPNEDKILFESTTPGENISQINAKQVEAYKKALMSNKIITEEESKDEDFFNKYYLADSIINLQELVAIHYYNNSFIYGEKKDYKFAFNQLEKANVLYPSNNIKIHLNYYLLLILEETKINYTEEEYCKYYFNLADYNSDAEDIVSEFAGIFYPKIEQFLKQQNGIKFLENFSNCLTSKISNDSIIELINDITHRSIAEYHYNSIEFDKALKHILKIYKPEDKSLNLAVKDCLTRKFENIRNPKKGLDSLNHYAETFPFIQEDKHLLGFKVWCQLRLVYAHFAVDEYDEGIKFFEEFKNDFNANQDVAFPENSIADGFGAVSSYYVRKNDYKMAKKILLEGLEFAPYNVFLKRKLKLLNSSYPELKNE